MKTFGLTDIGLLRRSNQDQYFIAHHKEFSLMVVCDGMGGANAGEVASLLACTSLKDRFHQNVPSSKDAHGLSTWLKEAVQLANHTVYVESIQTPTYAGMGTTLVAALFSKQSVVVANIGDSRAYLLDEKGELLQITEDHSLVNQMIKEGKITAQEAKIHPQRSVLTNVLGVVDPVQMDLFTLDMPFKLLVCFSDGVHGLVDDEVIETILNQKQSIELTAHALVQAAKDKGGVDNITVAIAQRGHL